MASRTAHEPLPRQQRRLRDERRMAALREISTLKELPTNELRLLGRHAVLRVFADKATILTERMPNDHLFIVIHGVVMVNVHDRNGREVSLGRLLVGAMFGEAPLFGNRFGGNSVVAQSMCQLLQIPHEVLRREQQLPQLMLQLRTMYRARLVQATLARVPFLAPLDEHERAALVDQLIVRDVPRGEYIVKAGNRPNGLHLIEFGECVVKRDHQVNGHLEEGDFFGAMALMNDAPASDDVQATTPCIIMTLPSQRFLALLNQYPDIRLVITQTIARRRDYLASLNEELDAVWSKGVRRGDTVFVRDAQRCPPGCRICVSACATRHGVARLAYDGILHDGQVIVDSCRQCRVAPECVDACDVHAIAWQGSTLIINHDTCTGCGACVSACQYQAVTMQLRDRSMRSQLKRMIQTIPLISSKSHRDFVRADKCDRCAGFDDMACVQSCPIGALQIVPVEQLFPY
ncbi:MAG: cyclic nucleotide-binding domain-containing protein [Roseiflexaceae bacterium]|jgi:CRP-like cAMP-binding protein